MSAALATPPPTQDTRTLPNLGRILGLVRCLIDFGRRLADNLREPAPGLDPAVTGLDFRYRAGLFGTSDVATILLRIARGLRRAAALETLLLARAQSGGDITMPPVRTPLPRLPALERDPEAAPRPVREPLPLEPSDEEIAADVRRRPVGAVIVEICLDLGVQPGELGRDMHQELMDAVMYYGGDLIRLLRMGGDRQREREHLAILRSGAPLPPELQPFPIPFAEIAALSAATGPP